MKYKKMLGTGVVLIAVIGLVLYIKPTPTHSDPPIRIRYHNRVIYGEFNPDRSAAYTCTTQAMTPDGVGMVCTNPTGDVTINCTTTTGNPTQYFC